MSKQIRKIFSLAIILSLIFQQVGFAQVANQLNIGSYLAGTNNAVGQDKFRPLQLRYFAYNNLKDSFKIVLDKGDLKAKELESAKLKTQAQELLNYFLIGVTLPDSMFWVNLRPDAQENIIDPVLARTDIGKIMLEADLQLKKDTASFTSSQTAIGKEYWSKLYKKAEEIYGSSAATIPTLTRPWIVPGEIIVRESGDSAYVYKANLKVMLEQDTLNNSATYNFKDDRAKALNEYSSQLIRELVIPELTKEINSAKRYAPLRQVYYSLILARWFKLRFAHKTGTYSALINANNLTNLTSHKAWSKTEYFNKYQSSFAKGEYNEKEQVYTPNGQMMRSYFSGGTDFKNIPVNGIVGEGLNQTPQGEVLSGVVNGLLKTAEESSNASIDSEIAPFLNKLEQDKFEHWFTSLYGWSYGDTVAVNSYLAKIAFDGTSSRLGWTTAMLKWIENNPESLEKVLTDGKTIRENYKYVIFCGMGGSGLSVQAVKDTFGEKEVKMYSLRTTDPQIIADILKEIAEKEGSEKAALAKTLVIPISKSGTTQETVSHKQYFEDLFGKYGIPAKDHLWVVTDTGSPMDTGVYTQREIQLNGKGDIGGRFTSPTTNIFLLPLAISAPEKVKNVLKIAKEMNVVSDIRQDQFLKLGAYLYGQAQQGRDKLTMIVPEELKSLPSWSEQLIEESLGKDGKGVTLFYGEKLDSPQVLKLESKNDRVFLRINIDGKKTDQKMWDFLVAAGYPVFEINIKDIDAVGGVMLGLQRSVAAVAYLWDLCFVNQPAVEGYKKATRAVMQSIQPGESVKAPESWQHSDYKQLKLYYTPLIEAGVITEGQLQTEVKRLGYNLNNAAAVYAAIINLLKAKGNFEAAELTSYGRMTTGLRGILDKVRYNLFTSKEMASKLGEGPDKNHSYHQNIEGGKDMWFSTYFMANKIGQPKTLSFDDNLLKAQAIGTVKSLVEAKRSVVLIAFDGTTESAELDVEAFFNQVNSILYPEEVMSTVNQKAAGNFTEKPNSFMYESEPFSQVPVTPNDDDQKNLDAVLAITQDPILVKIMDKTNLGGVQTLTLDPATSSVVKFATSGDRGTFYDVESTATENKNFNVQRVLRVAQGIAQYYLDEKLVGVIPIAYDNRALSREYAYLIAAVLAANGIESELTKSSTPVPVAAYAVASSQSASNSLQRKAGGIAVTASHNRWPSNGIKWVLPNGGAAPAKVTNKIQGAARSATVVKIMPVASAIKENKITFVELKDAYVKYVLSKLPQEAKDKIRAWGADSNHVVRINPMQGAGIGYLKTILKALGVQYIEEINTNVDRLFGQVKNEPNPDSAEDFDLNIFQANKRDKKIVEILCDGDSDRFGIRDVNGERFTANELIPLMAAFLWDTGLDKGKIAKTIATSNFSNALDASHGNATLETDTGFKNLVAAIESGDYSVVGEESAHVGLKIFKESKDDAFAVGLMSLWIIIEKGSLMDYQKEVEEKIGEHYKYRRIDTVYNAQDPVLKAQGAEMLKLINLDAAKAIVVNNDGKYEFYYSGNEKLFSELKIIDQVKGLASEHGGIAKVMICYDTDAAKSSGYKIIFADKNWIAIRVSGTGGLTVRLYVEVANPLKSKRWDSVRVDSVSDWQKLAQAASDAIGIAKVTQTIGRVVFVPGGQAKIEIAGQQIEFDPGMKPSLQELKDEILVNLKSKYGQDVNLVFVLTKGNEVIYDVINKTIDDQADEEDGSVEVPGPGVTEVNNDQGPGGIDFRALPMNIQPMGSFKSLNFNLPRLTKAELAQINIDIELTKINSMIQAGMLPSGSRVKELIAACQQKKEMSYHLDSLLLCLGDIFKLEEQNALESSAELKEALVIVNAQG
ncbi:MAG: hypothetical protein WC543_05095 [Candidatus Omnitrophota bacterium]